MCADSHRNKQQRRDRIRAQELLRYTNDANAKREQAAIASGVLPGVICVIAAVDLNRDANR